MKINVLNEILRKLINGEIPPKSLSGNNNRSIECYIESDFQIIWKDESTGIIYLVRLGSHLELFG
jgi:mRNA-degrading endonuclease YafQ of YafQ-DinJ toxin-antitoxin module